MTTSDQQQRAKRYEAIHNGLFVVETGYTVALLVAFLLTDAAAFVTGAHIDANGGLYMS